MVLMLFYLLLLPPLLAALLALVVRPYRPLVGWLSALLSLPALAAALAFAGIALAGGPAPVWGPSDLLRVDSLTALLLVCVTGVTTATLLLSPGLGPETPYNAAQLRQYHVSLNLFVLAMLLALAANNVGVMWIAIEATTIFSAFLIPLALTPAAVEASWKYILISSVGIALAFIGTVVGYFDFVALSGHVENALNWPVLIAHASALHPEVMRLAFVFLLVGYGTKAGIAPMHTWKPDAYGEAPIPLSALMSSALFAVAIYAILRWKTVVDIPLGSDYSNQLLMILGLLSLGIASLSMVLAGNYKRLLAYSSIEHTGLICLGLGLGPLGLFAALLHLVNHTVAKALGFFVAGDVEHTYRSPLIAGVRGLLQTLPWTGGLFAAIWLALMGLPPFGLFVSEMALFRAGFSQGYFALMGAALIFLIVAFISFGVHLNRMLYGQSPVEPPGGGVRIGRQALLVLGVGLLALLGLVLPAPLVTLLNQSVHILTQP
jgi:hydrogenase-4 component F